MQLTIPERKLTNPQRFVLEIAADGFNAYKQGSDGEFTLISSSPKSVGSDIAVWNANVFHSVFKTALAIEQVINEVT
jgi:hypothetical protein